MIEMIEERFGRLAGKVFLIIVVLAILSILIYTIGRFAVVPMSDDVQEFGALSRQTLPAALIGVGIGWASMLYATWALEKLAEDESTLLRYEPNTPEPEPDPIHMKSPKKLTVTITAQVRASCMIPSTERCDDE